MWKSKVKEIFSNFENPNVSAIVGAGASAGSGLKTFRGENGHYEGKSPQELASRQGFEDDPRLVWSWYKKRMENVFSSSPNNIHQGLVKLEENNFIDKIITQNVDNFHQQAGQSDEVLINIHGDITRSHCLNECGHTLEWDQPPTEIPVMCECGSYQRPSVVWFGEGLDGNNLKMAEEALRRANILLVIGTSGVVQPVASMPFIAKESGAKIIEFNIEPTNYRNISDVFIQGKGEEKFPNFVELVI